MEVSTTSFTPALEPSLAPLYEALAKAQPAFGVPKKTHVARVQSARGSYEYRYADLADLLECVRQPLAANGLALTFKVTTAVVVLADQTPATRVDVTTFLLHKSGVTLDAGTVSLETDTRPQSVGSAITYGKRYGAGALLAVASEEDDDGSTAQNGAEKTAQTPRPAPPAPAPAMRSPGTPTLVTKIDGKPDDKDPNKVAFWVVTFADGRSAWTRDSGVATAADACLQDRILIVPQVDSVVSKTTKKSSLKLLSLVAAAPAGEPHRDGDIPF